MVNANLCKRIALGAVVLSLVALASCHAFGQSQALQDKMATYSVRVTNWHADGRGDAGTGVWLSINGQAYVATNNHVAARPRGDLRLKFFNGHQCAGEIVADDPQMDVTVIKPKSDVKGGARLGCFTGKGKYYIAGLGGDSRLHFHEATVVQTRGIGRGKYSWVSLSGPVCSGDSGSGIYNESGEVVGVIWGSDKASNTCIGTLGAPFDQTFVKLAYKEQQCPPGVQCQPRDGWHGSPNPPRVIYYTPPRSPPANEGVRDVPDDSSAGDAVQPAPVPDPDCDCADKLAAITKRLDALEKQAPKEGPPGPQGPAGKDGAPGVRGQEGRPGADATVDLDALAAKVAAIVLTQLPTQPAPAKPAEQAGPAYFDLVPRKP